MTRVLDTPGHEFEDPPVIDPGLLSDGGPTAPLSVQPVEDVLLSDHDQNLRIQFLESQEHIPGGCGYDSCMIKEVIRHNLRRLMAHHGYVKSNGEPNQTALHKDTGVDQKSIGNLLREDWQGHPNVETLERLCPALQVSVWQFLMPNLPVGLPALKTLHDGLDQQMLELCAIMSDLPDEARRQLIDMAEFQAAKHGRNKAAKTT